MNETPIALVQPLAYRVWDLKHCSFFYTDVQPEASALLDRWTGLFDRQGAPLYENDIIRVHHDWKLGWVRALVTRNERKDQYMAKATAPDGSEVHIGFYCFADSYRLGNLREHPGKLVTATEQFRTGESDPWWLSSAVFRSVPRSCFN
jgi:hypothetical protein